jgi:hypothetical protein
MLQDSRSRVIIPIMPLDFQLTLHLQPNYILLTVSASNTNEYQESSWVVMRGRRVRLTISPPSVSLLSRHRRILISQSYRTLRSVTGMVLLSYMQITVVPQRRHTYEPPWPVTGVALLSFILRTDCRPTFLRLEMTMHHSCTASGCKQFGSREVPRILRWKSWPNLVAPPHPPIVWVPSMASELANRPSRKAQA